MRKVAYCLALLAMLPLLRSESGEKKPFPPRTQAELLKLFADEFVTLTPGQGKHPASFVMGSNDSTSEKPTRRVTLAKPFSMAKYEITQELYLAVMGDNPSKWKGHRNAVELCTWHQAVEFCEKATKLMRAQKLIGEDEKVRLPSEAEWEYACRAGTTGHYSHGDDLNELGEYCWYKANSKGHDPPVGKKKGNPWDLYDMHGYNWEWVADPWHANYEGAPKDGSVWAGDSKDRVIRGGSWADPADSSRSAFRKGVSAEAKNDTLGFRCVKSK